MDGVQILPLGSAEGAIASFREAGGVVEFVLVSATGETETDRHAAAAIAGMDELANRWETWVEARMAETKLTRDRFGTMVTHPERAIGRRIDLATFVGRAYDWNSNRIVSTWTESSTGGRSKGSDGDFHTEGYAEAFSDTPYPIRASADQLNDWFSSINRDLLGGLDEGLVVWSWSTDWSTWFRSGLEWWGAYLWTVEREGLPWITAIAASSTD